MTKKQRDPTPLEIRYRARKIRLRGYYNDRGEWRPPWDHATEKKRRSFFYVGVDMPRILSQIVDLQPLINAGILQPRSDEASGTL